jgi:6,7-dimethyl-8-ribityllumazine synthase
MLKSIHIGRYVTRPEDAARLEAFFEAIGFTRVHEPGAASVVFSAPSALISLNQPVGKHPRKVVERLKDVSKLIVLEVSNPDDILAIAQRMQIKVLADTVSPISAERTFWIELPGGIVVAVHGEPESAPPGIEGNLNATGQRFAVVVSRFNSFITERLLQGALDGLRRSGARQSDIDVVRVPGSFEIPSVARTVAETKRYNAIVCLGCLLRGDTAHYDVIVNEVTRGIGQSAQATGVPHAFGVLTCDTLEQAIDRAGLKMGNKGFEAALAAVEMANLKTVVSRQSPVVRRKRRVSRKSHRPAHRSSR